MAQYYLEHLPEDMIPYWDLEFTDGDDQPKDSFSASIVACGLLEMVKYMGDKDAAAYKKLAMQVIRSLYDNYMVKDMSKSNGLVLHSTYIQSFAVLYL